MSDVNAANPKAGGKRDRFLRRFQKDKPANPALSLPGHNPTSTSSSPSGSLSVPNPELSPSNLQNPSSVTNQRLTSDGSFSSGSGMLPGNGNEQRPAEPLDLSVLSIEDPNRSTVCTPTTSIIPPDRLSSGLAVTSSHPSNTSPQTQNTPSAPASTQSSLGTSTALSSQKTLWDLAANYLDPEEKAFVQDLVAVPASSHSDFQTILKAVQDKRLKCVEERWKVTFHGHEVVLSNVADRVCVWLNKFKQIGDIAVNADPVHAGLPWAGVRLLLQVRLFLSYTPIYFPYSAALLSHFMKTSNLIANVLTHLKVAISGKDETSALLLGLDKILYLINRCKIYEVLYMHRPQPNDDGEALAFKNLTSALIELYTIILQFLAKANRTFEKSTTHRTLSAFLNPEDVANLEKKCNSSEKRVEIEVGNCERYCQRHAHSEQFQKLMSLLQVLEGQNKVLGGLNDTVNFLSSRVRNEYQNKILSWVSNIQFEKFHKSAKDGRTAHTAEWLLQHKEFKKWSSSDESKILWLHGIRKSSLMSLIIGSI
jgi:hypothetical protein